MADKEGVSIQVEFDYEYKAKDQVVTIRQGETYLLVKKTNEDWWQVRKDPRTKAFYVPAQYVKEVRRALVPPQKATPTVLDLCQAAKDNLNRPHVEMSSFGRPSPSSTPSPSSDRVSPPGWSNSNMGSPHHGRLLAELVLLHNNNHHHSSDSADSPPLTPGGPPKDCQDINKTHPPIALQTETLKKPRNDSESGDELSSSSAELTQTTSPPGHGRSPSPVYANLQELKLSQSSLPPVPSGSPLHVGGDWETHKDFSGRLFYYNRGSGEVTWKPPRSRDALSTSSARGDSPGTPDSELMSLESNGHSLSDSQYGSPPSGWCEELDEHGHTLYVCEHTQEKWIKHVDDKGRPYFYNADGSRSEWELPKLDVSPQREDVPKSRSLERKPSESFALTKWRHSTFILSDKPSEKCGVLNVTKITENGKRVRKNWTSWWTVLEGSSLLFAKGQGGNTSWFGVNQSKPEFCVDLRGGSVDWASKEKSSKKNVIELKTRHGPELLIQSEIESVINDWFRTLTETISTHGPWEWDEAIEEDLPESPGVENPDPKKVMRTSVSVSMDATDQKKTRTKLRKFLTRRPTYQSVRDKGYIKDQVFGCSLISLCQRENSSVPNFVTKCIHHVDNHGLGVDGLYRVSGNLAVIQKLRFAINHDEKVELTDSMWEDVHVTTGALKMFFRELPDPLFTFAAFSRFVNAIKCSDYKQRVRSIRELIRTLPKENQDTMQVLFKHLRRVVDHGESNRMTTQGVAIVFGPTLLRPETETGNMAVHMVYQNQIVEIILLECHNVFGR